jgi:hypothetical protein
MPVLSREVRLAERPQGEPTVNTFSFSQVEIPDPVPGEVLVRNLYMSVDPYMRGRMNEGKSYVPPFQLDKPLAGGAVGKVIASREQSLPVGSCVLSFMGWREAFVAPSHQLHKIEANGVPLSLYLGALGIPGLTAWAGLFKIAELRHGETIFVSGGAGAVGSMACQLAKLHGCRVIASAGSAEKVAFLRDELKVDYAFNYRDGLPLGYLRKAAPDGIDVYFDNTGGPQLEAALYTLRDRGRVALCGGIAGYNTPVPGPRNLTLAIAKRLTLKGFIVFDHNDDQAAFLAEVLPALRSGKLVSRETVVDGLDAAPAALLELLHSGDSHIGKMIVKLAEE